MAKFKVGDVVRANDFSWNNEAHDGFVVGSEWAVTGGRVNSCGDEFVTLDGKDGSWFAKRFDLVPPDAPKAPAFKPGDRVVCIDAGEPMPLQGLKTGETYTVTDFEPTTFSYGGGVLLVEVKNHSFGGYFLASRFELAPPAPKPVCVNITIDGKPAVVTEGSEIKTPPRFVKGTDAQRETAYRLWNAQADTYQARTPEQILDFLLGN